MIQENIDFLGSSYAEWRPNGLCSVDIDGYLARGGLAHQAFATTPSASYTLSFTMSGNGDGPPTVKMIQVSAAGQSATFTWDTSNGNTAQQGHFGVQSWAFTAIGSRTELQIRSRDRKGSCCGAVLAAFSVTQN